MFDNDFPALKPDTPKGQQGGAHPLLRMEGVRGRSTAKNGHATAGRPSRLASAGDCSAQAFISASISSNLRYTPGA